MGKKGDRQEQANSKSHSALLPLTHVLLWNTVRMTDYLSAIVSSRRPFAALFYVSSCEEEEGEKIHIELRCSVKN